MESIPGKDERVLSKLIGYQIVLNPKRSGMWMDPINKITLSFFGDNKDKVEVKEGMDTSRIERAIKAGILKVFKNDKDISPDFGGPNGEDWHMKPLVEKSKKTPDKEDIPYLQILGRNKQSEIIKNIEVINNYSILERLKELEEMGKNPSSQPRLDVLNTIIKKMKETGGVGNVKELPQEKPDVVSAK